MDKIPVILLAAGGSERMGRAKQLLRWGQKSLIEYQLGLLLKLNSPLFVVLGANTDAILPVIEKYNAEVVLNENWKSGMGSSVACGTKRLVEMFPGASGALITLVDQPLIPQKHFISLIDKFQPEKKQIIASKSDSGWLGVPALFDAFYFDELQNLGGEQGAKQIIRRYPDSVLSLECGDLLADVDTPESYQKLLERFSKK